MSGCFSDWKTVAGAVLGSQVCKTCSLLRSDLNIDICATVRNETFVSSGVSQVICCCCLSGLLEHYYHSFSNLFSNLCNHIPKPLHKVQGF